MDASSQDVLGKATARLAHEIKNSLAGIAGALQVLHDRLRPSADIDDVLRRVDTEVRRIESSVKELSTFAERKSPVLKPRDLHTLIEVSLGRAPLTATTKITRQYQEGLPPMPLDEKMLGQAIHRILVNAQEAMPDGGTLTISTNWNDERVWLSIRDTGRGLPVEELDRVFEPFFTSKMRGLGLGLAISRTLVDAHGGTLSVASPPGGGTEFIIVLPRTA